MIRNTLRRFTNYSTIATLGVSTLAMPRTDEHKENATFVNECAFICEKCRSLRCPRIYRKKYRFSYFSLECSMLKYDS